MALKDKVMSLVLIQYAIEGQRVAAGPHSVTYIDIRIDKHLEKGNFYMIYSVFYKWRVHIFLFLDVLLAFSGSLTSSLTPISRLHLQGEA